MGNLHEIPWDIHSSCRARNATLQREIERLRLERDDLAAALRECDEQAIVDKLDKTEDGVPITSGMELWQIDRRYGSASTNDGKPWQCGDGWQWQRQLGWPVYSSEAAAIAAADAAEED